MTLNELRSSAIEPARLLLPAKMTSAVAEIMLLAITQQEDKQQRRRQWPTGPARGLWQFEQGGGARGVLMHAASREPALRVCEARGVKPEPAAVWAALEHDDVLAAAFARLLLWTDAKPLPARGEQDRAWAYYLRTWRPGHPRPEEWPDNYRRALAVVR